MNNIKKQKNFSFFIKKKSKRKYFFILFLIKFSLGNELLSKETIGLPEIIEILGERPFGMSATMKDYLKEMEKRKTQED